MDSSARTNLIIGLIAGLVLLALFISLSSLDHGQYAALDFLVITREDRLWTLEAAGLARRA